MARPNPAPDGTRSTGLCTPVNRARAAAGEEVLGRRGTFAACLQRRWHSYP